MPEKRRIRLKPFWIWIHKWVGILSAIFMIVLGLTGSVIVVWREADAWLNPALYTPAGPETRVDANTAFAIASATDPTKVTTLLLPDDIWPVYVAFQPRIVDGRPVFVSVHIDPSSGKVLGERDFFAAAVNVIYFLHADLLLRPFGGAIVVGIMGLVLFVSAASGIYLWWPKPGWFWRAVTFRWRSPTAKLLLDVHASVGFWISIVMLVVAVSGVALVFPKVTGSVVGLVSPTTGYASPDAPRHDGPFLIDANTALRLAAERWPGLQPTSLSSPSAESGVWRINLSPRIGGNTRGLIGSLIWLDAWTGETLKEQTPSAMTGGDLFMRAQLGLHNGAQLGVVGRAMIFISGLGLAALALTGLWLWLYKSAARRAVRRMRHRRPSTSGSHAPEDLEGSSDFGRSEVRQSR